MNQQTINPDLQGCFLCEDVRQEVNGMHTLVGVLNAIPAPMVPIGIMKLCLWSRWCSGMGEFVQTSRILSPDEVTVVAESEVRFRLQEMETHATNVHFFTGIQLREFGLHHVEVQLDGDLRLRFPLPVVRVNPPQS